MRIEKGKRTMIYNSLISAVNVLFDDFPERAHDILMAHINDECFDDKSRMILQKILNELTQKKPRG